jgi:hypothetical protein
MTGSPATTKQSRSDTTADPLVMRVCLKMFADMIEIVRSADPAESDKALSRLTDVLDDWEYYFENQVAETESMRESA